MNLWIFFKQNWRLHGWRKKALYMFCFRPLPSVTNPSFVRYKKGRSAQVAGCWSLTTSWPPVAPCLPPPILSEGLLSKEGWEGIARSHLHETSKYNFIRNISPKNAFMVLQIRSLIWCCLGVAEWLRMVGWLLSWWPWRGGRRSTARSRPWFRWMMFISLYLRVMGYRVLSNTLFFHSTLLLYCVMALFRIIFRITLMI